jgi:tetratricopeptide (TPR) repeat protein
LDVLKYEFINQTDNSATIAMSWEKRVIPFKVGAETQKLQIEAFKNDFRTTRPYYDYIQAANYCLQNNIELEQALAWMDRAIYFRVMGEKNFRSLSTKAAILTKLNRLDEAKKIMDEALPMGSMLDVHFYGRNLLIQGQTNEAFKVFKLNYDKNPGEYTTNVGLGRGYSALGDYKKALVYMKAALPKAPDDANKTRVESMIKTLQEGKNIN